MTWRRTGIAAAPLGPGAKLEVSVDGTPVVLTHVGERYYALDAYCTHEGGILAEGELKSERLICPLHGATFDVRSGKVLEDPDGVVPPMGVASPLGSYAVRTVGGMIEVDLP